MKKSILQFFAAAGMAFCLCTVFAAPAAAAPSEVVGGAPGSEQASSAGETGASEQKAAESAGLVPALPVETKAPETEAPAVKAPETKAAAVKAPETAAVKAPETASTVKAPEMSAPAETKTEAPAGESSSVSGAPASGGKSTYAADAPKPDQSPEAPKQESPKPPAESTASSPKPSAESTASSPKPAAEDTTSDPNPGRSHETLTDEELEALDRVTGPGVAKVQGGSSYGVNEPTVTDVKTSGAAPATDWSRVSDTRKRIVDLARSFIGGTYVYGGDSPSEGFDCSGLILYVYKEAADITLYHQSAVQATKGRAVSVSEMQPGDIIAYDGSPKDGVVNHVSIYAGDGKAIHAVGTGKGIRMTAFDYAQPMTIRNLLD